MRLLLRNGPMANEVRLASGAWATTLALAPAAEQAIDVPFPPGSGATWLTIDVARGFRPAEVDPSSRDRRFLGCWIEVR